MEVGYNLVAQSGHGAWSILPGGLVMAGTESGIGRGSEGVSRWYNRLNNSYGGLDACSSCVSRMLWISGGGATRGRNYRRC